MRIDSHQHFWHYSEKDYGWISPEMGVLKKDYLPEDLSPLLQSIGFEGSVAVQARQTIEESNFLLNLSDDHPLIKGVVGWVDIRSPMLKDQLRLFSPHKKFCGIRHVLQDEPDDKFMLREDFVRGLRLIAEYGLTYDLLIKPPQLPAAGKLVGQFPQQKFVVDHIAKPYIKDQKIAPWDSDIRRIAEFPNVLCKVSGMVTEADWHKWQPVDFHPCLDVVFDAFGPERIMIGSDWPVCTLAGDYAGVMKIVIDYIQRYPEDVQAGILGENALLFYDIAG